MKYSMQVSAAVAFNQINHLQEFFILKSLTFTDISLIEIYHH